ncbi:MAG: pyridoxal phosphate-dependent aminotransferase [Candidatus Bathyarchaeota archaeon]|nr:pyridoxal phosphate-dependent aminotransferase [Candidatus Bathyarchaeota archaeon]MDH5745373.1 pyridoxal phosphate-dependent aminotransferase [Candidatus Bathyarchaeota archaeon]
MSKRVSSVPLSGVRKIMEYAKGLQDIIPLNIGEPDFVTPKHIREAAKKSIDEGFTHYTTIKGIPEIRRAIAEKLMNENKMDVDPENEILVTAGTQAAFSAVCQALLDPGDEVIVQDPFYSGYEVALRIAGAKIVPVSVREQKYFAINPNEIKEKVTDKTKMVVLISPNNPTGNVLNKHTLNEISDIANDHDLLVVSDEIYEKITYDDVVNYSIGSIPGMEDRTITINGFSKTYAMTGWRIGFVTACEKLMGNISKVHHSMNVCACSISQRAALVALTGPQDCVTKMVKEYDKRRREITNLLNKTPGFECKIPKGAFYVFPNVKQFKMSSMELAKLLIKKARVVTVPGSAFGKNGEGYLRLSYATSLEKIREALARIKKVLTG